jgi:hypothetical protein
MGRDSQSGWPVSRAQGESSMCRGLRIQSYEISFEYNWQIIPLELPSQAIFLSRTGVDGE